MPGKKEKFPLSLTHPNLAKEADGWNPSTIAYSSKQILRWKCIYGHSWTAKPVNRSGNGINVKTTPCPICSGLLPEKGKNDLATLHPEISKEADGWNPAEYFPGSNQKMSWICSFGHRWKAVIYERAKKNSRCPYCANTKVMVGFNDLETLFPKLAAEAQGWDPKTINPGSHKKYPWKCSKGHIWITSPMHRTRLAQNCAVCDNKQIQIGVNDLQSQFPEIAKQANGWDPSKFTYGSKKRMSWKCSLGHLWRASIGDMTSRGHLCPYCSNKKFLSGFNDIATRFPFIASEADGWDPKTVHSGTRSKKSWRCILGHTWVSAVNSRTQLNAGCPSCAITGFDPNKDAFLYFLFQENWQMYQIGITNDLDRRLKEHSRNGWELVEVRGPMEGYLTKQWENSILRMLKAKGADLANDKIAGKFDGYSEAWSKSTFEVQSIKELMNLTENFEEA